MIYLVFSYILNGLGFQHYFDVINSSGLFGQAKPQADIFIDTAQQLAVDVGAVLIYRRSSY